MLIFGQGWFVLKGSFSSRELLATLPHLLLIVPKMQIVTRNIRKVVLGMAQDVAPQPSSGSLCSRKRLELLVLRHREKQLPIVKSPLEKNYEVSSQIARSRQLVAVASSGSPPTARSADDYSLQGKSPRGSISDGQHEMQSGAPSKLRQ